MIKSENKLEKKLKRSDFVLAINKMEKYLKFKPEELWNNRYLDSQLETFFADDEFWKKVIATNYNSVPNGKDKKRSYKKFYLELNEKHKLVNVTVNKKKKADLLVSINGSANEIYEMATTVLKKLGENISGLTSTIKLTDISVKDDQKSFINFFNVVEVKKVRPKKKIAPIVMQSVDSTFDKIKSEFPEINIPDNLENYNDIYAILSVCKDPKKDFDIGTKVDLLYHELDINKNIVERTKTNYGYITAILNNHKGRPIECTVRVIDPECETKNKSLDFIWHGSTTDGRWLCKSEVNAYREKTGKILIKKLTFSNLKVNSIPCTPTFKF